VLLEAMAMWGPSEMRRLTGMFAFALVQPCERRLILANDAYGIKPLYYTMLQGGFAFASEIKVLLDWLPVKRTANPQRLYDYLRHGTTDHGDDTFFSAIRQVPAAHYLTLDLDAPRSVELTRYWKSADATPLDVSFDEAVRLVRDTFLDNLRLH